MSSILNVISQSQNEENIRPIKSTIDASPTKNEDSSLQDSSNIMESPPKPAVDKDLMQKKQVASELIALCEKVMNVRNNSDEFIAFVKEQKNMAAPLKKRTSADKRRISGKTSQRCEVSKFGG
ncbi:hypothetical protein GCK72_022465 [Caenorhabditis remanei]|uniref:Uncharacterized protein n=1 Tax=Caenorhabditis remanei TaxID=31234 RepID=A0A6A5FTY5_CAERE|nr:hypothetical protein GCK72_022465 [Caenorhabditis remanei]KAF1746014.1 hypothetical protein GCK72_022465 [Caenorhabditis remanei]